MLLLAAHFSKVRTTCTRPTQISPCPVQCENYFFEPGAIVPPHSTPNGDSKARNNLSGHRGLAVGWRPQCVGLVELCAGIMKVVSFGEYAHQQRPSAPVSLTAWKARRRPRQHYHENVEQGVCVVGCWRISQASHSVNASGVCNVMCKQGGKRLTD